MNRKNIISQAFLFLIIFTGLAFIAPGSISIWTVQPSHSQFIAERNPGAQNSPIASNLSLRSIHLAAGIYGYEELAVDLDTTVPNPFDPQQIDLLVRFISPNGTQTNIAAFWYQDYDSITLQPLGEPEFRVRFTPDLPGEWTAQAFFPSAALKSEPFIFIVGAQKESGGFVRLNPKNTRYLALDDGSFFFPIGLNMAWSRGSVLAEYQRWLDLFALNGGNTIRVWMASWAFGLEWKDTGLGDYSLRLRQAWLLDQVFEMAQARGIYIILDLINHGAFSTVADSEWQDNPYNAALGGPCAHPQDFISDPQARNYFKRRLRYITSRWSYAHNLMAWEWWNEVDWTRINDLQLLPWFQEMGSFMEQVDPYHHLITNSYRSGDTSILWAMPGLSFTQVHDYSGADPEANFPRLYDRLTRSSGEKPALIGEYGNPSLETDQLIDKDGLHLHNGLWAAPFSGFAGTAMYWWWDLYIDPAQLWPQFKSIAGFMKGEDLTKLAPGQGTIFPGHATAMTLSNDQHALIWIRSDDSKMEAARIAYSAAMLFNQVDPDWHYHPTVLNDLTLKLDNLQNGTYNVAWYLPQTAQWLDETSVQVKDAELLLPLPTLVGDLAIKIHPAP